MTDDLVERLRQLDAAGYPGRGDRLDPALVVRAGRHRTRIRRFAGTSAACVVVLALAVGVPALAGYVDPDGQTLPVAPAPTTTAPGPASTGARSGPPSPTPTATPATGHLPDAAGSATPAPAPVELGPGIAAATGLSSAAGAMTGDGGPDGVYYLAGDLDGASVRLGFGSAPAPWYTVFAVKDETVSGSPPGVEGGRTPLDAAHDSVASSAFQDVHAGYVEAGFAPSGAEHAFVVSTTWFEAADGSHRHAFELPLFDPPSQAAAVMGADRRMYVVAWAPPATEKLLDATSDVVHVTADGTIVDPSCDGGACDGEQLFAEAYAEIRATLGG